MGALLREILAVASLSLYFDPSLLALCWRSVGKISCGNSPHLDDILPHIITELCETLVVITKQSAVEGDPLLEKQLKSGRFLSSLMLRFLSQAPVALELCGKVAMDMLLSTHQAIHAVDDAALRYKLEANLLLVVSECTMLCMPSDQCSLNADTARTTCPSVECVSKFHSTPTGLFQ